VNLPLADRDVIDLFARLKAAPRGITSDSRKVAPGDAFAAFPGATADGRAFIADAIARGAGAVLWDTDRFAWKPEWQVPNVGVPELRRALGALADFIYGHPSQDLWLTGVTGTNGKTSCSQWIAQSFEACGRPSAVLGTLGHGMVGRLAPSANTTPDAAVLHQTLAALKAAGARTVAMEVSSIGLEQGRVNAVAFDVALFTNLSRDHLDYHGTMAAYGAAKAKLFRWPSLAAAVINVDDAFGQGLIDDARGRGRKVLTYGLASADIAATAVTATPAGLALSATTPWGRVEIDTSLVGEFNAYNLLGVLGVLLASDVPLTDAAAALAGVTPPPGRMQRFGGDGVPLVVVDYAHSPDALEKALLALKPAVAEGGSLVCVFGCGGDRDPGKRPEMGRAAASLATRIVVTSDNPRGEEPGVIAQGVMRGLAEAGFRRYHVELDRATAIRGAVTAARWGDVVLIAGKGHEDYQEAGGVRTPFSDAREVEAALATMERS
jgi:UDP-N-acetylmuramoyl-L-alanyl-D-glutamate--2,6-diaminopimelate ligase